MDEAARDAMLTAVDQYNRGDYLTAQEALENLFNTLPAEDQPLVRSLMILATAMHLHFRRGGGRGVLNLLRQAMVILDEISPAREGVATGELFDAVQAYLQELESRKKPGAGILRSLARPKDPLRVVRRRGFAPKNPINHGLRGCRTDSA